MRYGYKLSLCYFLTTLSYTYSNFIKRDVHKYKTWNQHRNSEPRKPQFKNDHCIKTNCIKQYKLNCITILKFKFKKYDIIDIVQNVKTLWDCQLCLNILTTVKKFDLRYCKMPHLIVSVICSWLFMTFLSNVLCENCTAVKKSYVILQLSHNGSSAVNGCRQNESKQLIKTS